MDDDGLANSLKLDVQVVSDGCFRETQIKSPDEGSRQTAEITLWNRTICLTSSADNVFLYESRQKELRVFKRIRRQEGPGDYRRELSVMERVLKEVEPHQKELFVDFIGWFSSQNYIHFVLEYCPYGDISTYSSPLPEMQAWCVCNQVIQGLSVLHKLDITHRDIKPQNVLVVAKNPIRVKIADFGISKLSPNDITQPRTQIGTDGYMAPECFGINNRTTKSSYTHAVDIWSLGCLTYYILTKEIPIKEKTNKHGTYRALQSYCDGDIGFPEGPLARNQVSLSGRYFIQRLLAPVAEDRPTASGKLMMNWVVPSMLNDVSNTLTQTENSSRVVESPATDRNTMTSSPTQLSSNPEELFELPELLRENPKRTTNQRRNENNMDLQSSDLWHVVKSERGSKPNEQRLRALLITNASPNIHLEGYTALHIATEQGTAKSVKILLDFKADTEARTELRQETPIHLASCQGEFESFSKKIQLLVNKGADIDAQNFERDTALHLAICRIGTADAINILLKSAASTELKGRNERTPLQYAIFLDREEIAAALLDHGANPNCVDENGLTPLHLGSRSSKISTEFLGRLIKAGANINKEDGNHHTPLYEAITQGRNDAIRLLINHGAECKPHHRELERYVSQPGLRQKLALRLPWLSK